MPQMSRQLELPLEDRGEAPDVERRVEASTAPAAPEGSGASDLLERVLSRPNMQAALRRVRKNKGRPGIDGLTLTVDELPDWLREHWPRVREELLAGTYQPQPVKRQLIPKRGGGQRELGIPTVFDRLIQVGWKSYFRLAATPRVYRDHDEWIRHRLRALQLKQWKRGRTTCRELVARGLRPEVAAQVAKSTRRWWKNSALALHLALPNRLFDELGLPRLDA